MKVLRAYVEKKDGFDVEARELLADFKQNLQIKTLKSVRVINLYDISGIEEGVYEQVKATILHEPPVDNIYDEAFPHLENDKIFAIEYLPGQYDQRADSAAQCIQILTQGSRPEVRTARVIVLNGDISDEEFLNIKSYYINPVDSREADLKKLDTLEVKLDIPSDVQLLVGFNELDTEGIEKLHNSLGLAMSAEDLKFCQSYFRDEEGRNPYITEIRVIDTYWSDHCRHTTFLTEIEKVSIENGKYTGAIKEAYEEYKRARTYVYGEKDKPVCLMDLAIIGMKELKKMGKLNDMEQSEENNACSIVVNVDVDGKEEEWLIMFKNETHNHPTEIEPFGGAATCLGGSIRDPLSGRAYVYQAMRVTGSGDPRTKIKDTLNGKLPQRKITIGAAHGYSSYGNQIGLSTGQVAEIYDDGYVAKRMEIGAVIAAAPRKNVKRESPETGDVIILLGGRTGRDGCGGATGSSKEHTEESILTCGAEVQKGNPPTERKIQRLFRNEKVSSIIKKCNDFGAGGVSVAIGELADGLSIDLDRVPKKYEGLDGTELAISESQERMAVVVRKEDCEKFIEYANEENLEAVKVAIVTDDKRLKMVWRDKAIVNIKRSFLDTNGVRQRADAFVTAPLEGLEYFKKASSFSGDIEEAWLSKLSDLNVCSQKGLVERFDSSIGASTVLMPFGGKYQLTPTESMAAKVPVLSGDTRTGTLMSYGYNPSLSKWSPFHGGVYAVVEAAAKIVANGGDYKNIRLTCQEYFEKLGKDETKWGKPFSSLLGAYYAQKVLEIPSIGGKDSMSGTFKDMTVPPTLVAFAVDVVDVNKVISQEFKKIGSKVILISLSRDEEGMPLFDQMKKNFDAVHKLIDGEKVLSSHTVKFGGIVEAISKMCFGNKIGFEFKDGFDTSLLFAPDYGSFILEIDSKEEIDSLLKGIEYKVLGITTEQKVIKVNNTSIELTKALKAWQSPLEEVFHTKTEEITANIEDASKYTKNPITSHCRVGGSIIKPKVFVPVFPGTNCEYDTKKAFENSGAEVEVFVTKNLTQKDIEASVEQFVKRINKSQIIMIPGGFSAGDEPEGSGKFIATVFRNPRIKEAVMELLNNRDGLMLGICNGFQALVKLGLLPYGEIRDIDESSPTLTFNKIARHVSTVVTTKVTSKLSPWLNNVNVGDTHSIAVSHGEGRFYASEEVIKELMKNGQIATQYVDLSGNPTYDIDYNPNGSVYAIEGITSLDGRILGKMGHSERRGNNVMKNIWGEKDQLLFKSGVEYFK